MRATLSALLLTMTTVPAQDPAKGISKALAEHRAKTVGILEYELSFDLSQGMSEVAGEIELRFSAASRAKPLVLDFGGHGLRDAKLNGRALGGNDMRRVHDHLVIRGELLGPRNRFSAKFVSKVAPAGTPLTVYRDPTDGSEYLYTLLVPSDAHDLFPCFDQPDLKAMFHLTLAVPDGWVAVANEPVMRAPRVAGDGRKSFEFRGTQPLPTYLFAFAAGPFAVAGGPVVDFSVQKLPDTAHPMRIYLRKSKLARLEKQELFDMHLKSLRWYEKWFGYGYPFTKLDVVLCPGFPYGGMEHAGAIFYRESALLFDHEPTEVEKLRRSTLIYHEVAHQWFGNLVTMRWFDDLWLKEGFATFMGYSVLAALEPERAAWLRFHQRVKPAAYRIDVTQGTVPIYQKLDNLDDAKSNYGPIVYNKAPAVLQELEQRIGPETFRKGVEVFLQQHAFDNARWDELLDAFRTAGAEDLDTWSKKWILSAGMPKARASFEPDVAGRIGSFRITQTCAQGWPTGAWPMRLSVLVENPDGAPHRVRVAADHPVVEVPQLAGKKLPQWVLLNPDGVAYGQFLLDARSRAALPGVLMDERTRFGDPLIRAVAMRALVESAREAELPPARLVQVACALLEDERDPLTFASLLGTAQDAITRWLAGAERERWRDRLETLLLRLLETGELKGLELTAVRVLARLGKSEASLSMLRKLADGESVVPGLVPGPQDRFLAGAALLASGDGGARARLDRMNAAADGDVAKYHYQALAAAPDAETKERYFAGYLNPGEPPEQWISGSLEFFHWPGQSERTLPWLGEALDRLEWVKEHRRIFFMPAWIDAFLGGHASPEALAIVERFLDEHPELPIDIRRKLVQSLDGLRRAVRIKGLR